MAKVVLDIEQMKTSYGTLIVGAHHGKLVLSGFAPLRKSEIPAGYLVKPRSTVTTRKALGALHDFFAGKRQNFDLPMKLIGTPFQKRVWRALSRLRFGETISYGELAKRIGSPQAARAIGMACNRNRLGIVIPCHRVIGAKGDLVGYASGLNRKRKLLKLETCNLAN